MTQYGRVTRTSGKIRAGPISALFGDPSAFVSTLTTAASVTSSLG